MPQTHLVQKNIEEVKSNLSCGTSFGTNIHEVQYAQGRKDFISKPGGITMKKDPMPRCFAIGLMVIGVLLGSVFTFGMQYWNKEVPRESCTTVKTEFVSYNVKRGRYGASISYITLVCANAERYSIDGATVNTEVRNAVSTLSEREELTLLIHPNSGTVVELVTEEGIILTFDDAIRKLGREATGFLFIGLFMYFCAFVGLYHTVLRIRRKRKQLKGR